MAFVMMLSKVCDKEYVVGKADRSGFAQSSQAKRTSPEEQPMALRTNQ